MLDGDYLRQNSGIMDKSVSHYNRTVMKALLWLVVFAYDLQTCHGVSGMIKLPGNVVAPPVVSVIEGANLSMSCNTDYSKASIVWSKPGDTDFYRGEADLNLVKVRVENGGQYICRIFDEHAYNLKNVTVDVNILYAAGRAIVTGPASGLRGELINVTCSAVSNPDPAIYWSYNSNGNPVVHRGRAFTETHFPDNYKFYCFAETTLVPTQGDTVTSTGSGWKKVDEHVAALIYQLPADYSIEEGATVDIFCRSYGNPAPYIYWNKFGSNDTINEGGRFLIPNVGRDVDGVYTCHAENVITNAEGNTNWGISVKRMILRVQPKDTATGGGVCPTGCTARSGENMSDPKTDKSCSNGIIAALVIGWIVVLILILIGIFYCIRMRDNGKTPSWSKHHTSIDQTGDPLKLTSTSHTVSNRPELPKPPLERELSQHSYMSLQADSLDRGKPDGSYLTSDKAPQESNDGYITPQSKLGASGGYVEPYITSVDTPKEATPGDTVDSARTEDDHTYDSV